MLQVAPLADSPMIVGLGSCCHTCLCHVWNAMVFSMQLTLEWEPHHIMRRRDVMVLKQPLMRFERCLNCVWLALKGDVSS